MSIHKTNRKEATLTLILKTLSENSHTNFKEQILEAYERILFPTKIYQNSIDDILSKLPPSCDSLLEIGCGTGSLLTKASKKKINNLYGIDENPLVIKLARQKNPTKTNIICGDFLKYQFQQKFSTIIANNLLNVVQRPLDVLEKAYSLLQDGGRLLVSTPKKDFSLDELTHQLTIELQTKNLSQSEKEDFELIKRFNENLSKTMNVYSKEELEKILLQFIGFENVSVTPTYGDQNNLFIALKESCNPKINYFWDNQNEHLENIKELRNYCLRNLLSDSENIHSEYDDSAHHFIAIKDGTKTLAGVVSFIDYTMSKQLPIEEIVRIADFIKYDKALIGTLYSWYVLPTHQHLKIGSQLTKEGFLHAKRKGLKQLFLTGNPEVSSYLVNIGCEQIGNQQKYKHLNADFVPFMLELDKLKVEVLQRYAA
ncbi:methyltransferase domain-containing protein [Candidatus Woesearchaeota archaeon]|nr:methyltransferase domain-containing protein [Candidatus Woesearchaeota archaeon]